jgi:hypothetical protein
MKKITAELQESVPAISENPTNSVLISFANSVKETLKNDLGKPKLTHI